MKKNMRVVQINGFRGILLVLFIATCLIAGFIAFPSFVAMFIWNYLSIKTGSFPVINLGQGLLLWGIIVLSIFIFNKNKFIISFNSKQELTEDELKKVISKIKSQKLNNKLTEKSLNEELEIPTKNDN